MNTCIIFCAGGFQQLAEPVDSTDYLLAADGGLAHMQALELTPHGIIGDFDSLGYVPQGAQVFPVEKDDTDSMLAVRKGLEMGYRRFVLYGALDGERLDHTVANLQVLGFLCEHGATGYLAGLHHTVTAVKNGVLTYPAQAQGILSVFCLGEDATGVTLSGLKYPLANGVLTSRFPLGVSNHFVGQTATVRVEKGCLLAISEKDAGFPEVEALC